MATGRIAIWAGYLISAGCSGYVEPDTLDDIRGEEASRAIEHDASRKECLYGGSDPAAVSVEIDDLLDRPEDYTGKLVRVAGFITMEFEGLGIYRNRKEERTRWEVRRRSQERRGPGIWYDPDERGFFMRQDLVRACHLRDAELEGIFNPERHGHYGAYAAAIERVRYIRGQ